MILRQNDIIVDKNERNLDIFLIESKRKRCVYAIKLSYKHRQTIRTHYEGYALSLLLIDQTDSRAEVTLLNMPIQTNQDVIKYMFQSMNPEWKVSDIRRAPGNQTRGDRWQLRLESKDIKSIPDGFILYGMAPGRQDVNVKIFVSGTSPHRPLSLIVHYLRNNHFFFITGSDKVIIRRRKLT